MESYERDLRLQGLIRQVSSPNEILELDAKVLPSHFFAARNFVDSPPPPSCPSGETISQAIVRPKDQLKTSTSEA